MLTLDFSFATPLWKWSGGNWFFLTLPTDTAADIRAFAAANTSALGTVRVVARVGETEWQTSLFPSNEHESFLLPVKAAVRRAEKLEAGAEVNVALEVFV